jgi:hypothetical protein
MHIIVCLLLGSLLGLLFFSKLSYQYCMALYQDEPFTIDYVHLVADSRRTWDEDVLSW